MPKKIHFNDEVIVIGLEGKFRVLKVWKDYVDLFGPFPVLDNGEPNFTERSTCGVVERDKVLHV